MPTLTGIRPLAGAVTTLLALVAGAQTAPGHTVLRAAGLAPAATGYTELAFTHPEHLPVEPARPRERVAIAFTLHNAEATTRTYAWSVVTRTERSTEVLARGRTTLPADAALGLSPQIVPPCAGQRMHVEVELAAPRQAIGFWRNCRGAAGHVRAR